MAENEDLFELTPFERKIGTDQRWKWVWDDASNSLIGYVRHSNGYTEMRDRNGKIVYTDEIPIQPSLVSPVDFVGGGPLARMFGATLRRGAVRLSGMIAKSRAGRANLKAAVAQMKAVLNNPSAPGQFRFRMIEAISRQFGTRQAMAVALCRYLNDGKLWTLAKAMGIDVSKFAKL